ncbi:bestrophin family protein [Terriglobus tenax]|uniref:bestrophin family protein n=1 Tax=Terriglobus tenax TaxID=1111115 RepID=UPI0021E033B6|nr:bestrophin family ion channel [Terriglobus tenax]
MITINHPPLRQMAKYIGLPLALLFGFDALVVIAYQMLGMKWIAQPAIPLSLLGSAIGVIVGFRNNSAYGRWWEARTLWGSIVNNSRSLARQAVTNIRARAEEDVEGVRYIQQQIVHLQIAWVNCLRQQLRGLEPWWELKDILPQEEILLLKNEKNVAVEIQKRIGFLVMDAFMAGYMTERGWGNMDETLTRLCDAQGGAERIKNTPMPRQYDYFPRMFVHLYCLVLPLAMVANLGWWTPFGSTGVGLIFLALNKIGTDLEDPFSNTIFDIPLTAICRTIEVNLRQILAEKTIPPMEKPIDGVLW